MRSFTLAFLSGILILHCFKTLPSLHWLWLLFSIMFILIITKIRNAKLIIGCLLGFSWILITVHDHLSWSVPDNLEGQAVWITGDIYSIPDTATYSKGFLFKLSSFNQQPADGLVKLSWRNASTHVQVGDTWQLQVKLNKIHSLMNPGGFDMESYALQNTIRAQGYVVSDARSLLLATDYYHGFLSRVRQALKEKIEQNLPKSQTSAWIEALIVGERHGFSREQWEVLRNTGTNHLMAIAGLHIGFISGFVMLCVVVITGRIPRLMLIIPAKQLGAIAAILVAVIYAVLAGFSLPTERACIMLIVFFTYQLLKRKIGAWQAWSVALLCVLVMDPLCILMPSFWLSFGAVALIIYGVSGRIAPSGWWWKIGRIQWVITLGLIPLSIGLFQQCSLIALIANAMAIPWVGFIILPLCFIATLCLLLSGTLGGYVLWIADKLLSVLWILLNNLSHLPLASWYLPHSQLWVIIVGIGGVLLLLLPRGMKGRWFGLVWCLPLIFIKPTHPDIGDARFTLLDVGQGLSAVVETATHVLVFDTGSRLSDNVDMGASVVVPFLHSIAANTIDTLVVSHGDNDHFGGSAAVLKEFNVKGIKTSVPDKFAANTASLCLQNQAWEWDHVQFEFLYPVVDQLNLNNNSSCVLRVSVGQQHILLTGDIEASAEKYLVSTDPAKLAADIIVAPHHGSKTSAEDDFLQAVHPKFVLFPVGYRNRYHFPHGIVLEKYKNIGAVAYDSVHSGAITFLLSPQKDISLLDQFRLSHRVFPDIVSSQASLSSRTFCSSRDPSLRSG